MESKPEYTQRKMEYTMIESYYDVKALRIRIPPDLMVICTKCNSFWSMAHEYVCPTCPLYRPMNYLWFLGY
jgi:hypothetical protein